MPGLLSRLRTAALRPLHGRRERTVDPLFDAEWYLAAYPDVAAARVDPFEHYHRFGRSEGRMPAPVFNVDWFAAQHRVVQGDVGRHPFDAPIPDGPIILAFDDAVPAYDRNAGACSTLQYLRLFTELGFAVVFVPVDGLATEPYATALTAMGVTTAYDLLSVADLLDRAGSRVHAVWLSRPIYTPAFAEYLRAHVNGPVLFCGRDLSHLRLRRQAELQRSPALAAAADRLYVLERELTRVTDRTVAYSDIEAAAIAELVPEATVDVLSAYAYDPSEPIPTRLDGRRRDVLFVGGFRHAPNADAVCWFAEHVWPTIAERIPDARFRVVGEEPPAAVIAHASERIIIEGAVDALEPLYANAFVTVAPLRFGAGVKGKIVSSMHAGVPVVTTPIGAEGMGIEHGTHVLISEHPTELAEHVVRLRGDAELWEALSINGRTYTAERYSPAIVRDQLARILGVSERTGTALTPT